MDFWMQQDRAGNQKSLIARFSSTLILACSQLSVEDSLELCAFLKWIGICQIEAEASLFASLKVGARVRGGAVFALPMQDSVKPGLQEAQKGARLVEGKRMERIGSCGMRDMDSFHGGGICCPDKLTPIYEMLCKVDADFARQSDYAGWLTELSHKCRHGLGVCYLLSEQSSPAATASVLFLGQEVAVCGGVAVLPEYRGKGYATRLMTHMRADRRFAEKILLFPVADDRLNSFYLKCGCTVFGDWAEYRI